jgi:5-methylcytosine-specific restriction protein A
MRSFFINVLEHYIPASQGNFTDHPIADLLRHSFPKSIKDIIVEESDRYIFKGSPGTGGWSACPWVAILDVLVTRSTQDGYYPVYIFREDMSGFYLTLNQGVTSVGQEIKKGYRSVLEKRADSFRMQINYDPQLFSAEHIDLRKGKNTKSHLPGDYEAGNIISKFYSLANVPQEDELVRDLKIMLSIYSELVAAKNLTSTSQEEKDEVEEINNSERTQTQKQRLIDARLGQGKFRKAVVGIEKNCRITGISDIAFLVASHIKPWSKSNDAEKLDGHNGLLLSPHVDKLFDKGFISFSDNGEVLIKDEAKDVFKSWNLQDANVGSFSKKQKEYLAFHRNQYQFK